MATVTGLLFFVVFIFAPDRGIVANARRRLRQKWEFAQTMLAIHLFTHEDLPEAREECRFEHLGRHMRWPEDFSERVVARAERNGLIKRREEFLELTQAGRELAGKTIAK
jgi:manganese/zinc/iron transport system permease protein